MSRPATIGERVVAALWCEIHGDNDPSYMRRIDPAQQFTYGELVRLIDRQVTYAPNSAIEASAVQS